MKISLNWLKDYLTIPHDVEKTGEILTDIGLEVEGIETVEHIKGGLKGVVVGHVKTCGQHPDADRLRVTTVDIGTGEDLQIVCGAPNVAAGQKVMVATIGTKLYFSDGKDLKIKKGKIRGQVSQGMICAEDELGIGTDHDGIIVLPEATAVGTPASDYYNITAETIYEIGLTPNRSDATAHLGVAQDLAAALKINYDQSGTVNAPDVSGFEVGATTHPISVEVKDTEACPRYTGIVLTGITVAPSPEWMQKRLTAIGVRPINNIVDITNYVLHELGQPLHAFDYDQITDKKVIVQTLPAGTNFASLDEVDRKLSEEDLIICDGQNNPMCMAGVFGGLKSGVTDTTKTIFLESAHFEARRTRRTSTRHLLRTDAAVCFEKGSDPNITDYALKRAVLLIRELAGGTVASELIDLYPTAVEPVKIKVSYRNIRRLIGVDIPTQEIKEILSAMNIEIVEETAEAMTVGIPTNKVDVTREVDVIEEILRIYGFNRVPIASQIKSTMGAGDGLPVHTLRQKLGDYLNAQGFNEIMGLSLSQSRYFRDLLQLPEEELVYVNNTSNIHLDVMRPTMLFSGLEAIVHNQNRQNADLRFFEQGYTYQPKGEEFKEEEFLSLFITGRREAESWHHPKKAPMTYYTLKGYVEQLMNRIGIGNYQTTVLNGDENTTSDTLVYGLRYHRGPQVIVEFGKVKPNLVSGMDIKQDVFYAAFKVKTLLGVVKKNKIDFTELTKYPRVRRDLALVIGKNVKFDDIKGIARKTGKKILKEVNLFDVYENEDQLGKDKKSYAVSFIFEDPTRTLNDKEIDKVMQRLIATYEGELGAVIRR